MLITYRTHSDESNSTDQGDFGRSGPVHRVACPKWSSAPTNGNPAAPECSNPDKRPTQRIGIIPDIEVLPTVAGIRDGRDEVLEAALTYPGTGRACSAY
jgi:hypothetical protein